MTTHSLLHYALLVLKKENEVLLLKRCNASFADKMYSLIGGKVEKNETFTAAIIREAYEEVGITVKKEDLHFVHVFQRKGTDNELIAVIFSAIKWEGEPFNREPSKHSEIVWFNLDHLPTNIIPAHKQALELIGKNNYYSEHNYQG